MADIKTNQSKVYNALKGMGYSGIGANEAEFASKMSNPKNRAKVYKALSERGYKGIGKDQAAFDTLIYQTPTQEQTPVQQPAQAEAQPQPTQQAVAQQAAPQQKPAEPYKPSDLEMMGFGITIGNAQGALDSSKKSLDKTIQNLKTYQRQQAVTGGVAKSEPKWNPETGEMEETYLTSAGTEHKDRQEAADVQRKLNDAYWREAHPLEAAEREIGQDLRDIRTEEERLTEQRRAAEGNKRPEDKTWWDYFKENFGASAVSGISPMGTNVDRDMIEAEMTRKGSYGTERQGIQREQDVLLARRRLAEDARQLLSDVRKDRQEYGFFGGMARAGEKVLETALNPHTWDFGEADLKSQLAVADAVIKSDSGLGISSNEQKLLDTWAKNAAINSKFGDQLSGWTKAGIVTGESLPFMLEMAMNPASGLGEAATAQLMKYSLKKYGTKWVKDHAKSMLAKKIATRLIGDVVGAGIMSTTTGIARVAADYENRVTGQVDIAMDTNGDVIYNGIKQDTKENPGAALFKALSSTSIENWSEMAGNYLGFVNSFFGKALAKTAIGKAGRRMLAETGSIEGVSLNKAQKFIYELVAGKGIGAFSQGLKQFADRTQWHGVIGEYLEEEIGNIANALVVGDMTLDTAENTGVFNLQQNIDTFCGVALMGGFMSALNTVGYAAHRYNYDIDRVSNANAKIFGDELWSRIRTTIDSSIGDPRGLNDTLTDLIGGDETVFDKDGKKAILKYAQAALEKQGAEMSQYQPRMASTEREEVSGENGKQWVVTSVDKNGEAISQQAFDTEDEAIAFEGELKMRQQQQDYNDYLSMTNKLSYPEAAQAVDEFIRGLGDGFDYAEAVAAINDPKSELGKQFMQFKTEKILQKAEANRAAIETFEEENGWTPGTVAWLAEQDPMQLDAEGLQMADQARTFLEGLAYPAGEVHVEHEQQVGAETAQAVVENVISPEVLIDANDNAGQQILDNFKASVDAMTQLFDRNEELKEEFYRLQGMGLSAQEIISSLDSFRPEEVQTIIDYFNANARYLSFMDEASKQIDNAARRSRDSHTMKGTINGNADLSNVYTITDGTNTYYLVSGNITTDPTTGQITDSDSGLIIGMDLDGSFVNIGDASGYSVMPTTQSLDQFEEQERLRLQEQITEAVDPNGTMGAEQPQEVQQGGNVGGEAGASTGTGADEAPTPAPANPVQPVNPPSPAGGQVEPQQPTEPQQPATPTIESVTDNDGIKRYENGISAEDAVADMIASHDNPTEIMDASIAEADEAINKINSKPTKTRKDLADRKKYEATKKYYEDMKKRYVHEDRIDGTSYTQIGDRAILEKDGKILYDTAGKLAPVPPAGAMDAPKEYADAQPFIDQLNAATSKRKADEILNEALQAGVNPAEIQQVHTQKVSDLITKEEEARRQAEEITDKDRRDVMEKGGTPEGRAWLLDRKRIPSYSKRIKLAKLIYGDYFDDDFDAWRDIRELISSWLGKGRNLDPDTFGQELGWDMGVGKDAAKVSTMFAARRQNGGDGMTFNDFVHMVMENSGGRFTTEDIRNELIAMFQEAQEKYDLTEYQLLSRVAEAENTIADEIRRAEEGAEDSEQPAEGSVIDGQLPFPPADDNSDQAQREDGQLLIQTSKREAAAGLSTLPSGSSAGKDNKNPDTNQGNEGKTLSREDYLTSHPLTEEQIMADTEATEDEKLNAIDFLRGEDDSAISRFYYDSIYERAQKDEKPEKPQTPQREERDSWQSATDEEFYPAVKEWLDAGNSVSVSGVQRHFRVGYNKATRAVDRYKAEKEAENQPARKWQYQFHYDKETGRAWITREDVSGPIPIGDGRFRIEGKNLAELRGILENPANNLGELLKEVEAALHNAEVGEQLRNESNPINAIETAAQSFREEQKSQDQQDIDDALKEFNDFLDKAKGSNVLDKFMRKGLEGNDKAQANLLDAFTLTNEAQRMFLKDLLRLASKVGYAYIKSGIHDAQAWSRKMSESIGAKLKEVLGWDDTIISEFADEVWNQKYTVDGVRMRLSEHAERLKNNKPAGNSVNVNKTENNEPEKDLSLQSETINNNNNGQQENQPVGGQTAASNNPTHGESPRPTSHVGQGTVGQGLQNGGSQQQGSSRVSQVPGGNSGSGVRSDRRLQGLNKNNNHEERGTESAPTTPRMRTQANIEAIRLMQQIVEEDRPATDEEKKILRKFSGWGGLGVAFEYPTYSEELRSLLGDAAYDQAQMSRNSAYFTPANIIDAMWDIAKALGFKGGNVLEGSAGIGKIIGLMPSELSDASNIQAVEIDETTGNILKLLYPDAQVDIQGFEDTKMPNGSIDLAITNVPFVTGLRVQDTTGDKDLSKKFHDIHDFCIAKNIRKLREGGIGIFITSNGTLDNSQKLRDWIISEGGADVVGAFRLNNKTFGGTGTTSDIIVVRKRVNGQKSPNAIDVSLPSAVRGVEYDTGETKKVKGQEVPVIKKLSMDYNGYFVEHPEHMGGEMVFNFEIGETYRPTSKTLAPSGVNQNERLNAWVDEISKKDWSKEASAETSEPEKPQYEKYGEGVKEGSLILDSKGNICIAQYGEAVPLGVNDKKVKGHSKQECLKDYSAIKNALNDVLSYQVEHEDNDGLQPLLDKLNKAFDQFVSKYGHFHNNTAIAFLRNDVDYASVGALETYKEKTDKDGNKTPVYGKADVFSRRVVEKEKEPQPKTIEDSVIASIYKFNGINIPYIAQQLGMSEEEAKEEILDKGLAFENPDTTQVEVSYVYLSGNVREKLEKAKANNENGKYAKNISALEKIIPNDIPAHLIEFNLGSTWIDKELYKEFFKEKTGKNATFNDANGTWFVGYNDDWTAKDSEGAVISELCDKTILTSQLIEAAMTGRTIKVQKTEKSWDGKTETITDNEATQACAARIDELKQDFKDWARAKIQSDPEMAEKAEKAYNEKFNNYVPMTIPDEFAPTRFGGQVTKLGGKPFGLRPHQSKAVIKGITQPVLFAHEVGTGKTFTLITTAMEMRRIGTAKKPMIVVQNATVGQFTESAKMLYPNAKILTMDEKDHSESARKQFYAKIKYNDWDLIIVPQSVLDKIPDSPDRQLAYINEKIQEKERILMLLEEDPANWAVVNRLRKELDEMYDEEYDLTEASAARNEKKKKRDEKKRAVAKQNAAVRAKEQLDRSVDDVEDFDDMEIDAILVDEAHGYKKLGFGSVMQKVKGIDTGSSKKCASLLLKTRAVLEKSHGKNVVFATGTPVSNTAAEVWTFMRYLMPEETMEEYGIKFFDDFARNFGNVQQMLEFTTSGKFKENNRFAGYVNMPELARIWRSVADIVLTKEAGAVQEAIPELEGGKATDIYLPQTKALRAVMKYVRQELERYEHMTGKEKKANSYIPLVMYGIAKAAAVDARLVDSTAADEPQSKTNEAVRQTLRSLEETKEYNGTIAIFADNYQNKQSGFNLYEDIKKKLVAQGVPSEQIAIIRSDMSDKKKLDIFDKVNSGEIRVVMGSTQTLGTGVNIQERLHTLIHMDAPNRPMDYTQRNGRELRQGNLHREWGIPVRILRFGVEDSLDVTAYQRLKTKGAIADSVMNAKKLMDNAMDSRVLEEEEDVFGDTVAQLSGSEYAMLKNQAEKEVRKLEARYKQWEADQIFVHAQMPRLLGQSDASRLRMEKAEKNLATVEKVMKQPLKIEINGKSYVSLDAMADFFKDYNSKIKAVEDEIRKSGVVQSQDRKLTITINGIPFEFKTTITGSRSHENGKIKFSTMRQTTFNNEDLIGGERNAKGGYVKNGVEEILNDYLSGNDYREIIETEKNSIARNEAQIKMLEERSGKEFTEGEALEKARERLEEYTQKMKEEMEAKEAKYKEMDSEVEASDSVTMSDEDEDSDAPKRMITTSDPMEAINQAAESWRQSNGKTATNSKLQEISDMVNSLASREDLKGSAPTYTINSRQDLEAMKGKVSSRVYREIERLYADPDNGAAYIPRAGIVVVFGEHLEDAKEAEAAWWHEQTHSFWQKLPENERRKFGYACFDWLRKNRPDIYNHITKPGNYERYDWLNEACAFLIGNVAIESNGTEKFLNGNFVGNPEICNFANELRKHIRNGRQGSTNTGNNQLRRIGEGEQTPGTQVRGSSQQGQKRGDNIVRPEEESELPEDPLEAIEQSAKLWRRERRDRENGENTPLQQSAKAIYNERLNRVETVFSEAYQDAMVSLKTAQNAIAGDKEIPDSQNAYMAENLMHGKTKNEQDLFNIEHRDPIIRTINKIMNLTGMNWGDIDRYVYTKSGLERNREFFVRDWLENERRKSIRSYEDLNPEEQEIYDRKAETIETLFEDGDIETEEQKQKELEKALKEAHREYIDSIEDEYLRVKRIRYNDLQAGDSIELGMDSFTFVDYLNEIDSFIRKNIDAGYKPAKHDYSGLRAMYGDENGKYDEEAIIEELMNTEDAIEADNVDTLWEQIQGATRYGLERYREAGMRSDEQIDRVEQMFHWYVPMRGFKEDMGEDMYQYFTQKGTAKSYIGGLLKHAKGRGSEAEYPISTIFAMSYKAIADCNQNLVNQKLYRLCQANPNDLVILSDSWAKLNETTGEWEETGPDIPEEASEEEVREATQAWEDEMRQLALENKAKKIKGREKFDYKPMDKEKKNEHIIDVRINGQPRKMIVVGNPRMAQALNGQLRFEHGKNVFSKWNAAIKNFMASVFTSYSPTFAMRNMFRDWTHFRMMLGVREGQGYASRASKYYRKSLFKMVGLFKKYRNGTLDESNEMERDFKDFMDNGGVTGFVFMQKVDDIQKEMEDIYKKQKAGKTIRLNNNLWEKILGAIEAVNEGIENNARFATYRASRHYAGRTKARSAYDAKEITVNFNRKGAGSKTAGFKSQNKTVKDAAKAFGVTSQVFGEGRIFFNATVQAIATTFKNFQKPDGSLNKSYIAKWTAMYALPPFMFGLALPMINKALAEAFGGDDDDDPYANLPEWTRRKNLCFYIGHGNFITIPVGQELAAFLTLGDIFAGMTYAPDLKPVDKSWDDEIVGVMNTFSPVDVDTKITKGGLKEDPLDETIGRTFSVLAPLVAVQQNLGWTGRPIYREDVYPSDKYSPEYQMVYNGTNPVLVNASKLANDLSGGDSVARGKIQVNPAIVQYLWEQYTGGPGKLFSNTISIGKDAKDILVGNDNDFNIRKVEGLKAFVQQGDDRTQYYRTQAKYRKYKADADELSNMVNGYQQAAATDPMALPRLERISMSEDFVRMQIVKEAEKTLSQINKAANKAEGKERKELRRLYNQQVKAVVDMLDEVGE